MAMLNIDRKTKRALNWLKKSELRMGHSMKDFEEAEDQIERLIRCIKHSKSQRAKTLTSKEMKLSKTLYSVCPEKLPPKFQYLIQK